MDRNVARARCVERWEEFTRCWLEGPTGNEPWPEPFEAWYDSYQGTGDTAPTRDALAEPFIGSWGNPRLVTLGLNPGAADFGFQGRDGHFTRRIQDDGYEQWARSDPYGSRLWEAENEVNPRRKSREASQPASQGSPALRASLAT